MTSHKPVDLPQTCYAVLGMLSLQPMSGYDLKQAADNSISHFYWSPAKSQIYAELRRLKKGGFVTEQHVEQEDRPDKRVYSITPEGQEALADWLSNSEYEKDVLKSNLMLRIFFGSSAEPAALLRLLEQNLEFSRQQRDELKGMEQQCLNAEPDYDATYSLLTIRAGIELTEAAVRWSEQAIRTLENKLESIHTASTRRGSQ